MNTDTLIETTWIKNPDKLHAVRFTEWQQADAIRELMGAIGFRLHASLNDEGMKFSLELLWPNPDRVSSWISQGDFLVTEDELPAEYLGDDGDPDRIWRIMTAEELQTEHQRYRPIR